LKARICEVSPYLLLKRTDIKPTKANTNTWDFTDFPTIDATELIRIHNTFCSTSLSKDFQIQYEEIRRNRNKISHLGIYRQGIDPRLIIDILQMNYAELYPGRRWMDDRLPASAPSPSPVRIRRPASLQTRRSRRCGTSSLRSATPARSARPIAAGSERREAAYRAHTVGSDGHFVGFEPLTWQLHRDHPPPARPPSSATATPRPR